MKIQQLPLLDSRKRNLMRVFMRTRAPSFYIINENRPFGSEVFCKFVFTEISHYTLFLMYAHINQIYTNLLKHKWIFLIMQVKYLLFNHVIQ